MKRIIPIKYLFLSAITGILFITACQKTDYIRYDKDFTGIYFQQDSIYYSFGVTPLEIDHYELKVPIRIMGEPAGEDRTFQVAVIPEKTTAVKGVHYTIGDVFTLSADSINGYIPVNILRNDLGQENDFKLAFQLKEASGFTPVNELYKSTLIHFNNKVERPTWKDWSGAPTWPTSRLGVWNPLTYIKFIELFRGLEQIVPDTYYSIVASNGPDLIYLQFGWPYDYDATMTKYVLIPLYQYFMEQHTDLGVTIPRPAGY